MAKVAAKAKEQGMRPQEWVRRLIKETLGEVTTNVVLSSDTNNATSVSRDEFEAAIAALRGEINQVKELEPVS